MEVCKTFFDYKIVVYLFAYWLGLKYLFACKKEQMVNGFDII